jgi:deoxyribonuclease V
VPAHCSEHRDGDQSPGPAPAVAAVDVHYLGAAGCRAALVTAADNRLNDITGSWVAFVPETAPYRPAEFYLRELPPLRAVLAEAAELKLIVVDGYVDLDPAGLPGLGAHVHAEYAVPVIGVAKSAFPTATHAARVLRGRSARPLFVTAAGISIAEAATMVSQMAGSYRIPDALRRADRLARGLEPPANQSSVC